MTHINIETGKTKNMRGRITGYYARIGDLRETGKTQQEATERLQATVERVSKVTSATHRTIKATGAPAYTLIVCRSWDGNGSQVMLVFPDGHVAEHSTNETEIRPIEASARLHVAQLIYGEQKHDATCPEDCKAGLADCLQVLTGTGKESEFMSWVKFQEAYRAARAQGKSDVEAHAVACGTPWTLANVSA